MAFPKLLQKLFQNNGAGDKLNPDIIPDIPYSKVTDAPSVDSALSSTSENPVQNKVITSALDGKLSTSGGTVNGPVTIASTITTSELARPAGVKEFYIRGKDDDGCLQLYPGGTSSFSAKKTASLLLTTINYTGISIPAGSFYLNAMDATTGAKSLVGSPNGTLWWCGKSLTGGLTVVAESYSANSWYRKYSDGWIEQWVLTPQVSFTSWNQTKTWVTFPVALTSTFYWTIAGNRQTSYSSYYSQESGDSGVDTYKGLVTLTVNKTGITGKSSWPSGSDHYNTVTLPANEWLYVFGK
jgi:hypothetical protein